MQRRSPFILSLLIATASAACSTDGGQPLPLEDLSDAVSTVFCDRVFDCYSPAERATVIDADGARDVATCTKIYSSALDEALAPIYRDVAAGRVRYDADAATACLSTVEAASCGAIRIGFDYAARTCMSAFVSISP
jgi:hypothetical protein